MWGENSRHGHSAVPGMLGGCWGDEVEGWKEGQGRRVPNEGEACSEVLAVSLAGGREPLVMFKQESNIIRGESQKEL